MKWLCLCFLSLVLFSSCTTEEKTKLSLSRFITEDAILALEVKNLSHLNDSLSGNDFLGRLGMFSAYTEIKKQLSFLEYVIQDSPGLLIFTKTKQDSLAFLYATEYALDFFSADSLAPKTSEILAIEDDAITKYHFKDAQFFARVSDNTIVLSSSMETLLAYDKIAEGASTNSTFEKLYRTSDKSKFVTLYLNPKKKDPLLNSLLADLPGLGASALTDWTAFDILGGKNQLSLNGVGTLAEAINSKLALFKNTAPTVNMTPLFAPKETEALLSYSFDNYDAFAKNQQDFLGKDQLVDSLFNTVEEIGFIHLNGEKAVLLNTYGPEQIADFLVSNRKKATDFEGNIILELSENDFLNNTFQPIVSDFKANYSTILENAFIFSKSKNILQNIISNYKKENTYIKNSNYVSAMRNAADAATMLLISDGNHISEVVQNESNLSKVKITDYTIVSQIVADGTLFHSNISAQRNTENIVVKNDKPGLKFALEQPIATKPQFVINHLTNKKEIVVQDLNNVLYLFSANGKTIWKKQLKAKIQGLIHQVDLFKNGRLQLAFTTTNEFLILDRNGKNVTFFDKSYSGETLNSLAVFDYDRKREYRFVVTQKDKVYMYDRKGKIVSGFKYTKAEAPIREAPQHMVIGSKDYLTFLLADGTFKALNRKGEQRVKAKEKIDFSNNALRLHKNAFTLTDKNGKLCQIDVQGNVKRIALSLSNYHQMDANAKLFVYMNENVLSINGKKTELQLGAYTQPRIIEMGINSYITVTDLQNQKVYLFDSQSKLMPNFPVLGSSEIDLADIDSDSKLELVTANAENSLVLYQLD